MSKRRAKFRHQVLNHGYEHSQYFRGCGVSFTDWTHCATGCGASAKEAYEDAVEMLCQDPELDEAEVDVWLPKKPRGVRADQVVPSAECEDPEICENDDCAHYDDVYWYVSVRIQYPMKKRA